MIDNVKMVLIGMFCGFLGAAVVNGDTETIMQCTLPLMAIAIIIGMYIGLGFLIDPKGMISFLSSIKSDWKDILDGED